MILLDTHAWVWWLSQPEQLSKAVHEEIERSLTSAALCLSCFSAWELALLVQRGRLELSIDLAQWIAETEQIPGVIFHPVNNTLALQSVKRVL